MPYDPHKDGTRETAPGTAIPHVSYRTTPRAAAAKKELTEIAIVSEPPTRPKPRRRVRRAPISIPWKQILSALLLFSLIAGVTLLWLSRPEPASPVQVQAPVVYVTATPLSSIAQTATSVLPAEYILSLSQTPELPQAASVLSAELLLTIDPPTPTPAFAEATPATPPFTLWGTKIVYVCYLDHSDEVCLMNADGSNQQRLTYLDGTDYYPSLSPDGQTVVFASQRGNGPFDIYVGPVTGGEFTRLTSGMDTTAPEISPDGTRVVFASTHDSTGRRDDADIWVVNIDGSNLTQLTFEPTDEIDPSWSPDGTLISFASNLSRTKELFIMNADGTGIRQLTNGMSIGGRNDWSPDGRWLTFYAGPGSDKDIFLIPIECADLVTGCDRSVILKLTDGGNNKGPSFSPDGQWITFASGYEEGNEIMIMRIDGSSLTQLTSNSFSDWQPRWGW